MVYTLEMMEHPVKMEVVGGKFLGKSMILSMNKPSLNSCPMWKYQLHIRPPNQRLFCCARDLIPVLARTQARRCCIPPGVHHKKFKIEIPRNGHVHYKKIHLNFTSFHSFTFFGVFFFLASIILLYRQHRPMLFWTTRPYHRSVRLTFPQNSSSIFKLTKMNHRMVVVVPLRNTMGWQLERIPKAMPMESSQVG